MAANDFKAHRGKERIMKKIMLILAIVMVLAPALYPKEGKTQMGPGMMGSGYGMGPGMMGGGGYGGWSCPYYGQPKGPGGGYGMGPGMMGGGMMGRGYGPQYGTQYQQTQKPMEERDAKEVLENYLKSIRNPNLKLGEIKDKGSAFEAEIMTKKEGSLVDKIAIDKYTGWMRSLY